MSQFLLIPRSHSAKHNADQPKVAPDQVYPLRLVLSIADSDQRITVPITERLVIGRGGGTRNPDIDLAPFNATKRGVSRTHAAFVHTHEMLFIEDLNSTNGTRINGYQIAPGQPCRLRNGDEIELGKLRLGVSIIRTPG